MRLTPVIRSMCALAAAWALPSSLQAAAIVFQAGVSQSGTYDHLASDIRGNGTSNNGTQMLVGYQTAGVLQLRTVMAFDLSLIPAGSTIDSITLTLTSDGSQSGTISGVGAVNLYEVVPNGVASNNMVEGQVSRTSWRTGSTWTTLMGDYNPTALSTATVTDSNSDNLFTSGEQAVFNSTTSFVAAAQSAFAGGLPLEFILLSLTAEGNTGASNFFRFASEDYTTTISR